MSDPYADPDSGILRNRLGLQDKARLSEVEAAMSHVALSVLRTTLLPGNYDLRHLQDFHRRIFGRVYPWAGELRTVAIAKTDMFCLPQFLHQYGTSIFEQLADDKLLRGQTRDKFVDRFTYFYAEVNALHPFREGNGRTQRAFFSQLSREAGHTVDWSGLETDENITASIASLRGDSAPLRAMLDRLIAR